jgi:hypothetical protein
MMRPAQGVVAMALAPKEPRPSPPPSRQELPRQAVALPPLRRAAEALLETTVSVPWERPVHAARLAFLRRVARPGEVSVHVACGTDRLGFIDVAYGLTTILTDVDSTSLDILAQQFAQVEAHFGPLPGTLQCRPLPVEALKADEGFPPSSVRHFTLLNLFNAHLYPPSDYPRLIDPLLSVIAPGGSFFLTASEADILMRRARARQIGLCRLGEVQGYYDENIELIQVHRTSA